MRNLGIAILVLIGGFLIWGVFINQSGELGGVAGEQEIPLEEEVDTSADEAILKTSFGDIKISLDRKAAPETVENFVKLSAQGFYNGLIFHRIVPGFVIQGGDPAGDGTGGPGYTLPAETGLQHKRGAVAAARLPNQVNPEKRSSGSQFYITLTDLPNLDGEYTVFGYVKEGMGVVDEIAEIPTDASDRPLIPVIIREIELSY